MARVIFTVVIEAETIERVGATFATFLEAVAEVNASRESESEQVVVYDPDVTAEG